MYLDFFKKLNEAEIKEIFDLAKEIDVKALSQDFEDWMRVGQMLIDGEFTNEDGLGPKVRVSALNRNGIWGGHYYFTDFTVNDGYDHAKNTMYREYMAKRFGKEYVTALHSFLITQAEVECHALENKLGETR